MAITVRAVRYPTSHAFGTQPKTRVAFSAFGFLFMSLTHAKLVDAMAAFIEEKKPYAATTIHFLKEPFSYSRSDVAADREVDWVKDKLKGIIFRLDRAYANTPHVGDRVAARDRFEAFCVVEKADRHPHVHMAWFIPPLVRASPLRQFTSEMNRVDRLCCLLETLQREPASLEARDSMLLKSMRARRTSFENDVIADWKALGWSVRTESTYAGFWSRYIVKEMKQNRDFTDRSFFLSELHTDKQRTRPTRYHSIDPVTGHQFLNLDEALIPKR